MTEAWTLESRPQSRKGQRHGAESMAQHNFDVPRHAPRPFKILDDGRWVLELRGLTLRWERVTAVLDKLAAADIDTLTVDALRQAVCLAR